MTTHKIALKINYRKNNSARSTNYGRYYPEVDRNETLSLRGLSEHIKSHGTIYTRDVIEGVLIKMSECIPELISQGIGVKLDGLGKFYPTAKSVKGGVAEADLKGVNSNDVVKGIRIRFLPDSQSLDNITSVEFKKKCSLESAHIIETTKVGGKRVSTKTPIAEWLVAHGAEVQEP
ncbi:MAG: hypothetical protein K6G46_11075 [Prevotella sp.]|nr:hypothetical protein [Prevotella sp.]